MTIKLSPLKIMHNTDLKMKGLKRAYNHEYNFVLPALQNMFNLNIRFLEYEDQKSVQYLQQYSPIKKGCRIK
jgi:hypothetical protein